MKSLCALVRARWALPVAIATASLLMGCYARPNDTQFELTNSAPADQQVTAGQRVTFDVTLRNAGRRNGYSPHLVAQSHESRLWSLTCKSAVGMKCPALPFADDPLIETMPPGASITFEYAFTIAPHATGGVDIRIGLWYANDSVPSGERFTTAHITAVGDTLSGPYQLYASNGLLYAADADFAGETLALSTSGAADLAYSFASGYGIDPYGFRVANAGRFFVRPDLIAGSVDFGDGLQPFVAARSFVSDTAQLDGSTFLIFGRELTTGSAPTSHVFSAAFAGTTLTVCQDAAAVDTVANCPAASQWSYALGTAEDGSFTATDAVHGDTTSFRIARSNGSLIFLRADASPTGRRFDVGMPVPDSLLSMTLWADDTRGRSGIAQLGSSQEFAQWDVPGGIVETTPLAPVSGGPTGLLSGTIDADGVTTVYAAVFGPLALVVGAPGTPADGLMQVLTN
jgi:hypothetical protein